MICPTCKGQKQVSAYFCQMTDGTCKPHMMMQCYDCEGTGELDDRYPQWKEIGERLKQERCRRDKTLREEAMARGLPVSVLSRMERGTMQPS